MAAKVQVLADSQPTGSAIREIFVALTGDSSYPTGGCVVGSAQGLPNLGTPLFVDWEVNPGVSGTQTWSAVWDYTNGKVKVNRDTGELANATNVSTLSLRGRFAYKVA